MKLENKEDTLKYIFHSQIKFENEIFYYSANLSNFTES